MSLVSYGASDESDTSDVEDDHDKITPKLQTTYNHNVKVTSALSGHISDEDEFEFNDNNNASVGSSSVTTSIWTTTTTTTSDVQSVNNSDNGSGLLHSLRPDDAVNSTSVSKLEDLPAPQSRIYAVETEEADLEDEVKPKASEMANAPKPPSKKPRQPVKITIPSLDEKPNDEDKELKKKISPSTVKSGLFSLLPAPVHSSKKEVNRPLIPYSLSKKPSSATTANAISSAGDKKSASTKLKSSTEAASTTDTFSKRMSTFNALTGYDSDSDEDDVQGSTTNFFSLSSPSETTVDRNSSEITTKRLQSEEVSSSKSDVPGVDSQKMQEENVASCVSKEEEKIVAEEKVSSPEPGAENDAPLDFRSVNRLSVWSGSSYGFLGPVGLSGPVQEQKPFSSYVSSSSAPSSSDYNMASSEVSSGMDDEDIETLADDDLKKFMGEKEFQKLHGKRKRGFDEAINFVDANVDDYMDPSEVTKHLTEETEYVSHKNKDNLPTAQQRRKKQITYLAYQAKERELELKNTWAQNRMTKKQTQSKYGF